MRNEEGFPWDLSTDTNLGVPFHADQAGKLGQLVEIWMRQVIF